MSQLIKASHILCIIKVVTLATIFVLCIAGQIMIGIHLITNELDTIGIVANGIVGMAIASFAVISFTALIVHILLTILYAAWKKKDYDKKFKIPVIVDTTISGATIYFLLLNENYIISIPFILGFIFHVIVLYNVFKCTTK